MVATEITAASLPQPRKKNRKTKDTARLNHIAGRGMPYCRMHAPEHFGHRAAALHGINHARRRGGVGAARTAGTDEGIGIEQQRQPIEIQRQRQLRERRTVFQRRPSFAANVPAPRNPKRPPAACRYTTVLRGDRAEDREGHAAARVARLARQVHRTLETVVAEDDAAGRNGRENCGQVADMRTAMDTDMKILPMKAAAHQRDGGGGRHDELEECNGAVGDANTFTLQKLTRK